MRPPKRENAAGDVVHVWARGNNKRAIFADDHDRRLYLVLLGMTVVDHGWRCIAYCLMDNHVHLLLQTPMPTLSAGMRDLQGTYARSFNQRHGRCNHLFGGRYGDHHITDDDHLWYAAAYVAHNPVRAGLCVLAEDWPWSSHAATIGLTAPPRWLDTTPLFGAHGLGPDDFAEYVRRMPDGTAEGPTLRMLQTGRAVTRTFPTPLTRTA